MKKIHFRFGFCLVLTAILLFSTGVTAFSADDKLVGKTVNVNTATEEEFKAVPLITADLASAIVEYREENGDFTVIEELLQVDGFNRGLLRKIKTFLLLEGIGGDECTC
jgi:competence ComEA-like helix-hairpin-helix protein